MGMKPMAIFLTGDTHGDFSRLRPEVFREQERLTKEDYVIICGDFGGVWDGSDTEQPTSPLRFGIHPRWAVPLSTRSGG